MVEEPVIEDLTEAKKVEEHAAEFEVAPVVASSNVEVGVTSTVSGDQYLKGSVMLSQEEPLEDSVIEVAEVPPLPKEGAPPPAANGSGHPNKGLVELVEGVPDAVVPEVSWLSCVITALAHQELGINPEHP